MQRLSLVLQAMGRQLVLHDTLQGVGNQAAEQALLESFPGGLFARRRRIDTVVAEVYRDLADIPVQHVTGKLHSHNRLFFLVHAQQRVTVWCCVVTATFYELADFRAVAEYRLAVDRPDVVIRPAVSDIGLLEQVDVREVAQRGDEAVEAALPELKQMVSWTSRLRRSLFGGNS